MGVSATVEDAAGKQFGPAAIPTAVHTCPSCGESWTGRPDAHTCGAGPVAPKLPATTGVLGLAHLGAGFPADVAAIQSELDGITASIRMFHVKPPDQVLRMCSAYTARLSELAVLLNRNLGQNRALLKVRTQQVDRIIDELDRQWKTASRLIEVQRQDIQLSGYPT
jgi:hypothetical protein